MSRRSLIISTIINSFIFVAVLLISISRITDINFLGLIMSNTMRGLTNYFRAFTTDSNVIAGICSLIIAICNINCLRKKEDKMPHWAVVIQYVAATLVTLTFITVVLFLSPMGALGSGNFLGYFNEFLGDLFLLHFVLPILTVVSLMLQRSGEKLTIKHAFIAVIPMVIYSIVYLISVLTGIWPDIYGFTFGGQYYLVPVVLIVMYALVFGIAVVIGKIYSKRVPANV